MSEFMNELQKRSAAELIDELNVVTQMLKNVSSSETLVTLNKKLLGLTDLVANAEKLIELSQQDRENTANFIKEFKISIEDFKTQVSNIDLSKLDELCTILSQLPRQLEKQIAAYSQTIEQTSSHVNSLVNSVHFSKWVSIVSSVAVLVGVGFLYFGVINPMQAKQQEFVSQIGEKSDNFRNLLLQRQIDLEHIKEIEALLTKKQKDIEEAVDFIKYLNHYDEATLLLNKSKFDNYRNKRNQ